ncbi:DUF2235 domain-containing protein [Actibacterium pelagium]|uniref:T6SS Phospholipase effector Tle1-like catalytic domain-containing protein n=1 Tax=Actibacterium pelagium TaxID=2029103 RepID=A0A917AL48_9RHOB|nr:DUF2235 domain-containing protein [Actibacterium pelagium]GGE59947.1 hypothetical protein GCM10011517_29410 [Actibacterium pelagium]
MKLRERFVGWLRARGLARATHAHPMRGPVTHVVILDGTMSTLDPGFETHAGTLYKLLCDLPGSENISVYYAAGIQLPDWMAAGDVLRGKGINQQIRQAYGYLSSRYHPGDRIFLFGYSRGAYAVRSLSGVIDRVGLLRAEHAIERNVRQAYRHYRAVELSDSGREFAQAFCHPRTEVEMIGIWDTVKALGLRLPVVSMFRDPAHSFHNDQLSDVVKHGFHALALDERRVVYAPVMWRCPEGFTGHVEQMWFCGAHGDVGGQLSGFEAARPLANISLVWMLEKAQEVGLALPSGWCDRFPCDVSAPSKGMNHGWGKLFVYRRSRIVGFDASEAIHPTARDHPLVKHWERASATIPQTEALADTP